MISTQTFENYPEFANAGQKSQPNDAKYAAGFIPSDVLPAEWLNWFLSGATKGVTALNTGVKSIEQEINAVLASRAVTPDITATNQLLTVLNKIKAEAVLAAHPVGSLYWTSKNENPAVTFGGGTWKQITDKFVLAAGSTYKAEATGGAPTVTLTVANLPSHSHTFTPSGTVKSTFTGASHSHTFTPSGTVKSTFTGASHSHTFTPSGTVKSTFTGASHSHTFTPSGTVKSTFTGTSHSHTFTPSGSISGGAYKFTGSEGTTSLDGEHSHTFTAPKTPENKLKPDSGSYAVRGTTTLSTSYGGKHAHSFTPSGTISVTTNPTFTGVQQTVSATQNGAVSSSFTGNNSNTGSTTQAGTVSSSFTGNNSNTGSATQAGTVSSSFTGTEQTVRATQGGTVASTFTGTSSSTGSVGSATAVNILPPYIVKYCWERTA